MLPKHADLALLFNRSLLGVCPRWNWRQLNPPQRAIHVTLLDYKRKRGLQPRYVSGVFSGLSCLSGNLLDEVC
jgi:hypothetical protein